MKSRKKNNRVYLQDILSAIERIEEYTSQGEAYFLSHSLVQDGVIRQLSVIGEASAKLTRSFRIKYPEIPWKKIVGMRNIIIHDYSVIDLPIIWIVSTDNLPALKKFVAMILAEIAD